MNVTLVEIIKEYEPIFTLLSTVLWAIYVFYTIRTFTQIQKQTELQMDAFVLVSVRVFTPKERPQGIELFRRSAVNPTRARVSAEFDEVRTKWKSILEKNLPDAIREEKNVSLTFTNTGRSHITWWTINIEIEISPGKHLSKTNIVGDRLKWKVESEKGEDAIAPGATLEVIIAKTGLFPLCEFRWEIDYRDMRGKIYHKFAGDQKINDENVLADPAKFSDQ